MSTPRTIIKFYDVYDLLPNYEHTRYFSTYQTRDAYFDQNVALTIEPTQHIRIDEKEIKIPKNISQIHAYTYMSIQNTHGASNYDHRYYCFITDMEYVSDMCTLVKFEVDVMQTFVMDGLFTSSMPYMSWVKRCHNETDNFGDNIVAEPFEVSNYLVNEAFIEDTLSNMSIVIGISTADDTISFPAPDLEHTVTIDVTPRVYYNNMYSCVKYFKFSMGDINSAYFRGLLKHFTSSAKIEELVDFYICPSWAIPPVENNYEITTAESTKHTVSPIIWYNGRSDETETYNKISGYTPKNKKLFTFPFNKLTVSNGEGQVKDYCFEFFKNTNHVPVFACEGSFISEPSVTLYPKDYKSKTDNLHKGTGGYRTFGYKYDDSITLTDYPKCAYNNDSYKYYQSQNGVANAIKAVGSTLAAGIIGFVIGGGIGLATGTASSMAATSISAVASSAVSMTAQTIRNVADMTSEQIKAYMSSDTTYGNVTGKYVAMEHNHKNFLFFRNAIEPQLAQQIDEYFTKYGYAQNKLINIGTYLSSSPRPYYAYVQTRGFSVLNGGFEQKYKLQIQNIMDKGITFWFNTGTAIGDYSVNNSPT